MSEVAVQGLESEYLDREEILIIGLHEIVQRENERQAAMAGLMTKQLRSPEWKSILEILVWILSGNSHADQPTERGPGGEDRIGDCYVAKSCMQGRHEQNNWHDVVFVGSLTRDILQRIFWMASAGTHLLQEK